MSNDDNKRPKLTVHEGDGDRVLGDTFTSSTNHLKPVPTLPNAKELKCFTANLIMRDMLDAFQDAHELGFNLLGVIQDHNLGGFQYLPSTEGVEFMPFIKYPPESNTVPIKKTGLELQFTFDLTKPFTDQFPIEHIKLVRDIDDILEAFIDIAEQHKHDNGGYGDLPKLIQEEPKPTSTP